MNLTLFVWRQKDAEDKGRMERYEAKEINSHMSFLEMLDVVNEDLTEKGQDPIAFDHDCREGICGTCSLMINGTAHGPEPGTTVCQLHMRHFKDGDAIYIEPWRARAFPVIKDLVVDRTALDRIMYSGGFVSVNTGVTVDANAIPIPKSESDKAMDASSCIGCGACVASCKNASAMLFVAAKVSQFAHLPQGKVERTSRVRSMVAQMSAEGFGGCTNFFECEAVCPKEISVDTIAKLNREYMMARIKVK
ncbi:MAG: succinate dehydrogenase/fumarate reductase iron-sulfur subunit [candidate division Zixibacteria bacterium]|nr:succinate dehydrogenase/fumarate reductase iron-sulfur subunit [candidate division Zixibacteria bacterium]